MWDSVNSLTSTKAVNSFIVSCIHKLIKHDSLFPLFIFALFCFAQIQSILNIQSTLSLAFQNIIYEIYLDSYHELEVYAESTWGLRKKICPFLFSDLEAWDWRIEGEKWVLRSWTGWGINASRSKKKIIRWC